MKPMGIQKWNMHKDSKVQKVIAVMSGKGGVGKSLVTSLLATHLNRAGYRVGILDCDLTGPSIPEIFGMEETAKGSEFSLYPNYTDDNIALMSINLLLPNKLDPVIWRGPVLNNILQDFWTKIHWGILDVLLLDLPPGTGDVPLTIYQSFPMDGVIEVSTPSQMASVAVQKAYHMADRLNQNILGEIHNMSYFICDQCEKKHLLFGELPPRDELERLGELPFDPKIGKAVDSGRIEEIHVPEMDPIVERIVDKLHIVKG
ncbi:MAG: P-loop NTPase [Tissierellia bacterium]|nr:P-loop NTPase [Tissierellia bacterium]